MTLEISQASTTQGGMELLDTVLPPGSGTPPHTHESPELFYILEGELTVRQFHADQPPSVLCAGAGSSLKIPSRIPHNYLNEGDKPVRMLVMLEQSMTAFFRAIGTTEKQNAPDFAGIEAAMQRHGVHALAVAA